jgi:hypothetical protein
LNISSSQVSRASKLLDDELKIWRDRERWRNVSSVLSVSALFFDRRVPGVGGAVAWVRSASADFGIGLIPMPVSGMARKLS